MTTALKKLNDEIIARADRKNEMENIINFNFPFEKDSRLGRKVEKIQEWASQYAKTEDDGFADMYEDLLSKLLRDLYPAEQVKQAEENSSQSSPEEDKNFRNIIHGIGSTDEDLKMDSNFQNGSRIKEGFGK